MIAQLVVALDGSARSLAGLPVAAALARRAGARLTAVTVCPPWRDCGDTLAWMDAKVDDHGAGTIAIVAEDPVHALLELADDEPGTVLCMTTHGRTGMAELTLGSVSSAVVRASARPVLVVGPRARPPAAFATIEVCVHGPVDRLAAPVLEWSTALRARPWLVAVQPPEEVLADDTPCGAELRALADAVGEERSPEICLRHARDAATELLQVADDIDAAVLIAATEARHGVEGLLLGSVAKRLVRDGDRPVLLVGPAVGR